ncbi:carbon storage regulator [Stieleria sp. JC731]|uniref:carbon storage regulator n=1 Tax=Pirellulaceae TaxID=2691357 RepID=UPI001E4C007E|nr:carbon storage regulator [Stieleria sp. JC731]MCC9600534.1 carbon storage regulator [Stieleria sp. JC731]
MLVLSRLEDQRVLFPEIGISICIVQARKGRTRLGIVAPKTIRVVRSELLPDYQPADSTAAIDGTVGKTSRQQIEEQIELATDRLSRAQAELQDGNQEDALILIGQSLAELDQLRSQLTQSEPQSQSWEQPQGVAETAASYDSSTKAPAPVLPRRIIVVNQNDSSRVSQSLQKLGFEIDQVDDGFHAFIELSRFEKADAIVFDQVSVSPSDLRIIRQCSQQPKIPVVIIGTGSQLDTDSDNDLTVLINTDHPESIVWEVESMVENNMTSSH